MRSVTKTTMHIHDCLCWSYAGSCAHKNTLPPPFFHTYSSLPSPHTGLPAGHHGSLPWCRSGQCACPSAPTRVPTANLLCLFPSWMHLQVSSQSTSTFVTVVWSHYDVIWSVTVSHWLNTQRSSLHLLSLETTLYQGTNNDIPHAICQPASGWSHTNVLKYHVLSCGDFVVALVPSDL